jgi:RHH-type proline utilization regulon transcriptional repressor/proline dehydrogenase/delta 1-pyrroline-5-carboxylate dehydrogenase
MNIGHFKNYPITDFSLPEKRQFLERQLQSLQSKISGENGLHAAPLINGVEHRSEDIYLRYNPSDHSQLIGSTSFATTDQAQLALNSAIEGLPAWRALPCSSRASIIRRVGELLEERHSLFTSLLILEAGKPFREADADVAEAIDFCNYYAEEMIRIGQPIETQEVLGEENTYFYQPRGVVAVISPWNFPLAIACGMTVAGLVTGNTVILKPSEQTSIVGFEFAKLVLEAGVPKNAFSFLPGRGEVIGDFIVRAPETNMIVFTGSREVGCGIIETAAHIFPKQRAIKKVVAELGGKNAIIVDDDADIDDALRGIISSAFGYSGQKCSACSRLIVVGSRYEELLERLSNATQDLVVGPASNGASFMGPVVDEESYTRIINLIKSQEKATLLCQGKISENLAGTGWYVPPTIFRDVDVASPLWTSEIFGPVLACINVSSFEEALELANNSEYGLTGGLFSRSPAHIERARDGFEVGNLYINRSITGALVQRQPFGGFKFSGVGSKAGGPDYLFQFMEPRTVSENTMRKGYTPDFT